MQAPETLAAELDRLLATAQAEQRMPSVSACVFRDGEAIWERVLGVADVASARPATGDDVYRIGSITKTFTAVLIMQLFEAGRIDLEAPLRTYLPEAPVGATVRMALSHLSGVQREPPGEIWESMQPPSREELIAGLEDAELVLRPGELWHYSNLVFALLGEIVMRVTGESYADVLQRRILDPLGLTRTSLRPAAPRASPYYVDPFADAVHDEPDPEVTESTGAAGWLWSTAADLARWGMFLAEGNDAVLPKQVSIAWLGSRRWWTRNAGAWGGGLGSLSSVAGIGCSSATTEQCPGSSRVFWCNEASARVRQFSRTRAPVRGHSRSHSILQRLHSMLCRARQSSGLRRRSRRSSTGCLASGGRRDRRSCSRCEVAASGPI